MDKSQFINGTFDVYDKKLLTSLYNYVKIYLNVVL